MVAVNAQQRPLRHEVADVEDVEGLGQDEQGVQHLPLLVRRQRRLEVLHLPQVLGGELPPHLLQPGIPVLLRVRRQSLRVELLQRLQVTPHVVAAARVGRPVDVVEQVEDVDSQELEGVQVVPGFVPQEGRHEEVAERSDEQDDDNDDADDPQLGDDLLSRDAADTGRATPPHYAATSRQLLSPVISFSAVGSLVGSAYRLVWSRSPEGFV